MSSPSIQSHKLGPLGAEPEFSESARMVQETVHRFAEDVMRPVGIKLDRMTPEEVIAPGSPYWDALRQFKELGFGVDGLLALEPAERATTMCILFEELGWGDVGLAIVLGVTLLPALIQGEIFFDNVRLSKAHLLAGPDQYLDAVYAIHTFANAIMGTVFTGCARSAYELALGYAHERRAGGVPIIRHQSVAWRLFHMFRKVEAALALTHPVVHYNFASPQPSLHAAMTSKITATQTSFEVASDSLQIFCGNGLTREYPIEKILRDARASLIEDGCNEILAIKRGYYLIDPDRI